MNHRFRNALACVIAMSVLPAGQGLAALPLEREAEIRALVEEAQVHRAAGRYEQALALLHRALEIKAVPWLLFNVGRVREVAAHFDLARRYYELAATAEDDAETRRKALEGVKRIDALAPRGILRLRVSVAAGAEGEEAEVFSASEVLQVFIDGQVWEPRLGRDYNLRRGSHLIEVSRSGYETWRQSIELGELLVEEVRLEPLGAGKASEPVLPSHVTTPPAATGPGLVGATSGGVDWLPWTVFGVGLVGALIGGYFIVDGANDWERVESAPSESLFQDEAQAIVLRGKRKCELGTLGAIAGGGLAVGGLLWALLGGSDGQIGVAPMTLDGPGLGVAGTF